MRASFNGRTLASQANNVGSIPIARSKPFMSTASIYGDDLLSYRPLILIACLLALVACSKVNQDNYAKLQFGMAKSDVEALLGAPKECSGALGMASCIWGNEAQTISVQYAGDKVILFSGKGLK